MRPRERKTASSAISSSSESTWLETRTVVPSSASRRRRTRRSTRDRGSRPLAGSSRSRTLGGVHERAGQAEALLLPAGQDAGRPVGELGEVDGLEQLGGPRRGVPHAVRPAERGEDLARGQGVPGAERVGHPAGARAGAAAVEHGVDPGDERLAAVGDQQARQDEQERRLAGAVRADQRGDRTRPRGQVDAVEGLYTTEGAAQPADLDTGVVVHGRHARSGTASASWKSVKGLCRSAI